MYSDFDLNVKFNEENSQFEYDDLEERILASKIFELKTKKEIINFLEEKNFLYFIKDNISYARKGKNYETIDTGFCSWDIFKSNGIAICANPKKISECGQWIILY